MLVRLTRTARVWAAIVLGALYVLAIVAPAAAMALGTGEHPAHCFTDEQLGVAHLQPAASGHVHADAHARTHVHSDGTTHRHDGAHHPAPSDRDHDPAACCGLFGLTAMAVDPHLELGASSRHWSIVALSFDKLTGRDPDRINRPPIVPLPL
jgi:hypothetical protein